MFDWAREQGGGALVRCQDVARGLERTLRLQRDGRKVALLRI